MARSAESGSRKVKNKSSRIESVEDSENLPKQKEKGVARKPRAPRAEARESPSAEPSPLSAAPAVNPPQVQLEQVASTRAQPLGDKAPSAEQRAGSLAQGASASTARKLAENIERIEALGQRLMAALSSRPLPNPSIEGPGPELMMTAASAWMKTLSEQPGRVLENQVRYWGETIRNYADTQMALARGQTATPEDEPKGDPRFANPLWHSHPFFSFVKRQYLINAKAMRDVSRNLQVSDDVAGRRIAWITDQIVDMMAPTNFLATNPDALERAVATDGESLVKGLENLVRDVELNGGDVIVSLADRDAFTVGENVGASEGTVVHRTPMYELIQYKPATDQVHELPLLIFPPWINKFYVLDLKPQNSLIKWLTEQGHTLFIVSWKNPDASYADTGLEDYVSAYLEAMDKVRALTGQPRLNVVGYCIGGTTLSLTLALLKQRGDDRVNSATLFTTLADFSDQGEFVNFLQDDLVNGIADEIQRHGIMRAKLMSRTMNFLRPRDLVWGPAIRSYMMGEAPPAFDLLFWNGDSTNLPGRMAIQYLRGLCQKNLFAGEGFDLMGHKLRLSDVTVPVCAIACEKDHIAPWKDCWNSVAAMGSDDRTFILSESGHIAGIVNPPGKKKYGFYVGSRDFGKGYEAWKDAATFTAESWWPTWGEWLADRAGAMVSARHPGKGLGPAPGTYVHEKAA